MQEIVLALGVFICLITDLKERKIYNIVLMPLFVFGVSYNVFVDGWSGLWNSVLGALLGIGILIIPFIQGGLGAGDVKLLAVIGAIKGPIFVFYTALAMGIAGGLIACLMLIFQGGFLDMISRLFRGTLLMLTSRFKIIEFGLDNEQNMLPYGLAIAIGVLGAYCFMG